MGSGHPRREAGVAERGGLENLRYINNSLHRLNYHVYMFVYCFFVRFCGN